MDSRTRKAHIRKFNRAVLCSFYLCTLSKIRTYKFYIFNRNIFSTQSVSLHSDPEIQLLSQKTAMMEHCVQQQHRFDVGNPTIVDCCFKTQALPVLEMCHILTTPQAVNRRTDTADMSATYSFLIASVNDLRRESGRTDRSNNQYTDATHSNTELPKL